MSQKIDVNGLLSLSGNDEKFVAEILTLYVKKASSDIEELKSAALDENWNKVAFVLHRMRSSATPLGLVDLQASLKALESDLKKNITDGASEALYRIIDRIKSTLKGAEIQLQHLQN